jgi:vacuolar-type H+-ATPase subunit H
MADLTKIDEVITELENQAESMKKFGNIVTDIASLSSETILLSQTVSKNAQEFVSLTEKFKIILNENEAMFLKMQNNLVDKLNDHQNNLLERQIASADVMQKYLLQIDSIVSEFKHTAVARIDELKDDNRTFFRNIESAFDSRFDKLLISIQSDIRNELAHSMKDNEKNISLMSATLSKEIDAIKIDLKNEMKQHNKIIIISIFIGMVTLGVVAYMLLIQ